MASKLRTSDDFRSSYLESVPSPYQIKKASFEPQRGYINSNFFLFIHSLSSFLYGLYFFLRFRATYNAPVSSSRLWGLVVAEFCFYISEAITNTWLFLALTAKGKPLSRPRYRLLGDEGPTIDVFITVCGEEVEAIVDTVAGACSQDYPQSCYRVFLLDDAKDKTLEEAIRIFNENQSRNNLKMVKYMARDKTPGKPHYFKAGNLRFGIDETESMDEEKSSEFIAALDADMIAEHDWLARVVPHLILDKKLALVSAPQHFYNVWKPDVLGLDSDIFAGVDEPVNDVLGCSQCCGSGYILRRQALREIGGWPLVPVGEDIYCSNYLIGKGWNTAYIEEDLQFGLAPGSLYSYLKQRMRWTDGSLIVFRDFGFYIPGFDSAESRTIVQRCHGMLNAIRTYCSVLLVFGAVLLPGLVLPISSDLSTRTSLDEGYITINQILLLAHLIGKIKMFLVYGKVGLQNVFAQRSNKFWSAPWNAYRVLCFLLPWHKITFVTTGSIISPANERSREKRQPLPWRVLSPYMIGYILFLLYGAIAFSTRLGSSVVLRLQGYPAHLFPFPGVMMRVLEGVLRIWIPVRYMLFPPDMPKRRDLLQHEGHNVYQPKNRTRGTPQNGIGWADVVDVLIILLYTWL